MASSIPPVPQKIAERIWRGKFVAMWELLPVKGPEVKSSEERKDKKKAPKIQSIPTWVLGFSVYVVVMAKKHPEQVPAYMVQIVQASRSSGAIHGWNVSPVATCKQQHWGILMWWKSIPHCGR